MLTHAETRPKQRGTAHVTASILRALVALALVCAPMFSAYAEDSQKLKSQTHQSIDPMNRPMEELGVTGHDTTLCSDRWYSCSTYDRQQFDQKYPGRPLNELLRFGEPNWPDRPRDEREWRERRDGGDSFGYHDRLDKD
jgi:hypothetical protein